MAELTTMAIPYARAVFNLAQEKNSLATWHKQLTLLATIVENEEMQAVLDNPKLKGEMLSDIVIGVAGKALDTHGKNLVKVLGQNDRLKLVPFIASRFETLKAEAEDSIEAEVISAFPLTEKQRKLILDGLQRRFGKSVALTESEDSSLLGGAIIRTGDLVIDGSIRGRLGKLGSGLVH